MSDKRGADINVELLHGDSAMVTDQPPYQDDVEEGSRIPDTNVILEQSLATFSTEPETKNVLSGMMHGMIQAIMGGSVLDKMDRGNPSDAISEMLNAVQAQPAFAAPGMGEYINDMAKSLRQDDLKADLEYLKDIVLGPAPDLSNVNGTHRVAWEKFLGDGKIEHMWAKYAPTGELKTYRTLQALTEIYGKKMALAMLGMRVHTESRTAVDVKKMFGGSGKFEATFAAAYSVHRIFKHGPFSIYDDKRCREEVYQYLLVTKGLLSAPSM